MGMDTHVIGIVPPDARWKQMKKVWDTCQDAGIQQPKEVLEFFNYETPDPAGVELEIEETPAVEEWSDASRQGFEVHIDRLPPHVKIVRFYNSW